MNNKKNLKEMKKVLIGLSWPYANGRLHIGHAASSLPADALARFHRSIGSDVSFITGSDCFGTPIMVQAGAEGVTPTELAEKYHRCHDADFRALGFTFDNYSKTMSEQHQSFVQKFHAEMYKGDYVYEKSAPQLYCEKCKRYLPDRYVEGICPHCKKSARGDCCDHCGQVLEAEELLEPKCKHCGGVPVPRNTSQLYLKLSALQDKLQRHYDEKKDDWTQNAVGLTGRYLKEGLVDRAITRNIEWGVPLPQDSRYAGSEWAEKRIYVWCDAVLGYLSASKPEFWEGENLLHYYVHAKDNIPFHSLILPGLLLANPAHKYHLPDMIVSSEYITLEGQKMSKSKGNILTVEELLNEFDVDMIRYYFLRTSSDKKDSNFTFADFVNTVNGELVNNFGNLVNRTLSFAKNKFDGKFEIKDLKFDIVHEVYDMMHAGTVRDALGKIMDFVNYGNKRFDEIKPWVTKDQDGVNEVITIIKTASEMLAPFIPNACDKVLSWLSGKVLPDIEVLFKRLDMKEVQTKYARYCK